MGSLFHLAVFKGEGNLDYRKRRRNERAPWEEDAL